MKLGIVSTVLLFACLAFAFGQRIEKPAQVRGRITTLWGEPVKQAKVSFYKLQGDSGFSSREDFIGAVSTDNDGNYRAVVPWGQYRVEIKGRRWESAEVWRYYLGEGDDGVLDIGTPQGDWHIVSRMKVRVIVKEPNGSVVPDATVTMIPAYSYNEPQSFVSHQRRTDAQGRYDFFSLEVGDFVVYVAKPGFLPSSTAFRLNNGEEKLIDIKLKVAPKFEFLPKIKK
jgi:Carboxypeptidase regulatory-like domain